MKILLSLHGRAPYGAVSREQGPDRRLDEEGAGPAPRRPRGGRPERCARRRSSTGRDGDNLVVVASVGGAPNNPAWFHNLKGYNTGTEPRHT